MNIHLKTIINILATLVVFSDAYSAKSFSLFELRGSYYVLPVLLFLCVYSLSRIYLNRNFVIIFSIIVLYSFYTAFFGYNDPLNVSKAVISILLNAVTFYMVLMVNKGKVKDLFVTYLNFALIVSIIGIAQELNNILRIIPSFGNTLPLRELPLFRITSIFPEPAHYCEAMIPALFVALTIIFQKSVLLERWKAWIIIIAFIFTFSTVGYFGIFISLLLLIINYNKYKYLLAGVIFIPVCFLFAYHNMYEFKIRVDGTFRVITGRTSLTNTNWSTFSLMSNWKIGFISFANNPLLGGGLGSHPVTYKQNIDKVLGTDMDRLIKRGSYVPLNVEDAGSLFNRLLSETGLLGLLAFLIFLIKKYIRKKHDQSNYLWIINNAILVFFIIKLLRGGHYFIYGVFLFFWIYYFSKSDYVSDQVDGAEIRNDGIG